MESNKQKQEEKTMAFHYKPNNTRFWHIGYYDDVTGKFRHESSRTMVEAEAKRKAKDFTAKKRLKIRDDDMIPAKEKLLKVSDGFAMFIKHKEFATKTIQLYNICHTHLKNAIGDKYLYKITNTDYLILTQYLNNHESENLESIEQKKLSQTTKATYTRQLFTFFNFLHKQKLVKENIIIKVKPEQKEAKIIPQDKLDMLFYLLFTYHVRYYDIFKLKLLAALRANEVVTIDVSDIDLQHRIFTVRNKKGKRTDKIPITQDLYDHLLTIEIPESGPLFPKLTYNVMKMAWYRVNKKLGLDYNIHCLRKTRGTELAEAGVTAFFLRDFMRHKSIKTTEQYYISININKVGEDINSKLRKDYANG